MSTTGIDCIWFSTSKTDSLFEKFKTKHKRGIGKERFINYLSYAATYNGLRSTDSDDEIQNKIEAAIKRVQEKKEQLTTMLPKVTKLSSLTNLEQSPIEIIDDNGFKRISIHEVPQELLAGVVSSFVEEVDSKKIQNKLINNLGTTDRVNIFLRYLAKNQLYGELTGKSREEIISDSLDAACMMFSKINSIKNDNSTDKQEVEELPKVISSSYIHYTHRNTRDEAIQANIQQRVEQSDTTIAFSLGRTLEPFKVAETAGKLGARVMTAEVSKAVDYIEQGLKKQELGDKGLTINIEGSFLKDLNANQTDVNIFMAEVFQEMLNRGINLKGIISNGQPGYAEAAIVAARALGLKADLIIPTFGTDKVKKLPLSGYGENGIIYDNNKNQLNEYYNRFSTDAADTVKLALGISEDRKATSSSNSSFSSKSNLKNTTAVEGENIASSSTGLAKKLTNPTNISVEYKGKTFRSAEHAYQTWKSGEFDEDAYNSKKFIPRGSKPVNTATSYQTMVEILTAKLEQHPELIEEINSKGGLDYIKNSTHNVNGAEDYWQSRGSNGFIKALTQAATNVGIKSNTQSSTQLSTNPTLRELELEAQKSKALYEAAKAQAELDEMRGVSNNGARVETPAPKTVEQQVEEQAKSDEEKKGITYNIEVNLETPLAKLYKVLSPQKIEFRKDMMTADFSTNVDRMIIEKTQELNNIINDKDSSFEDIEEAKRMLNKIEDPIDGRKNAIVEFGLNEVFNYMKEYYQEMQSSFEEDSYEYQQYEIILNHFNTLLGLSKAGIERAEKIRIGANREVLKAIEDEADNNEDNNKEDKEGATGNDGWLAKARTTDPHMTISTLTRRALSTIVMVNAETGDVEVDDLGNTRLYDEDNLHAILIKELSTMISPDDFGKEVNGEKIYPALESLKNKYPWVEQLIDKFNENPQLEATFYSDFRKDFIAYWKNKDGKSIPLNEDSGQASQKALLVANVESGLRLTEDSIYNTDSSVNRDNAITLEDLLSTISKALDNYKLDNYEEDEIESEVIEPIVHLFKSMGFGINKSDIKDLLDNNLSELDSALDEVSKILKEVKSDSFDIEAPFIDTFNKNFNTIAKALGTVDANYVIQSLRQGDETRYSYSAPNFIDTMVKNLTHSDPQHRLDYIEKTWGKYGWFREQNPTKYKDGTYGWKVAWIRDLYIDAKLELEGKGGGELYKQISMKDIPYIQQGDDIKKYTEWKREDIFPAYMSEYYAYVGVEKGSKFANYNFPIFADSPVAKFIKMKRFSGDDFQKEIIQRMLEIARQELWRMKFVEERKASNAEPIQNFDKRGLEFCFFPALNTLTVGEITKAFPTLASVYEGIDSNLTIKQAIVSINDETNSDLIDLLLTDAIGYSMNKEFENFYRNNLDIINKAINNLRSTQTLTNLGYTGELTDEQKQRIVKEYYYNQQFASAQIIEMTTTDLAFYKNSTDFQKRYKEVYAAGTKLYTNSKYGRKFEKTLYLRDRLVTSNNWSSIKKACIDSRKRGELHESEALDMLEKYMANNQVDAQAFRSLSSYRAILDMQGLWSPAHDRAFENFENNTWTMADFDIVLGTIKPFLYGLTSKSNGFNDIDDEKYGNILVPHQNKNSEFLILATINTIGGIMNNSPKMKALFKFMEKTGIDSVQFESAVKAGGQGIIDLNVSKKAVEDASKELGTANEWTNKKGTGVKDYYDKKLQKGAITQQAYNEKMQEFEPTEEELISYLSEKVFVIPTKVGDYYSYPEDGMEFDSDFVHTHNYDDYMIAQPTPEHFFDTDSIFGSQFRNLIVSDIPDFMYDEKGNKIPFKISVNGKEYTKEELIDTYRNLITENLIDSFCKVRSRFSDIRKLQEYLIEQVQANPKFPEDMVNAFEIVTNSKGEEVFNIPLHNPSTTIKIQELLDATFKNAVTRQKIKGGSAVLVSSFGFSDQLEVKRDPKTGAIIEMQCYMPAYSRRFYEAYMKEDGSIDIKAMEKECPELLRVIGFRIPTEAKYSMANIVIKGFLPQQNGGAIMIPAELANMAGVDYDKLY